ncbi:MAG: hypothetical protein ABSE07_06965 [Methanoregula sp.]
MSGRILLVETAGRIHSPPCSPDLFRKKAIARAFCVWSVHGCER